MVTYNPGIPQASNFPSQDQPRMLDNFTYLQAFGTRDHEFTLTSAVNNTDGTHKQVTLTNHATPGFTGANSVLYANTDGANSQLFFNNAAYDLQLTSKFSAFAVDKGTSFLPGGLLLNYGSATIGVGATATFTFATTFSAPPYCITIGGQHGTAGTPASNHIKNSPLAGSFDLVNNSGILSVFYYMAIGPA